MGLAFLSPWFLLGALAVALPILLHLRAQDTAPAHAFAAIRFLRRAPFEARRPRQLRDLLLLALRVAALVAAGARRSRGRTSDGEDAVGADHDRRRRHVVQHGRAGPDSTGRGRPRCRPWRARRRAIASALIRVDDRATVLAQPSLDRGAARAAVGDAGAGAGGTALTALLATRRDAPGRRGGRPRRADHRSAACRVDAPAGVDRRRA